MKNDFDIILRLAGRRRTGASLDAGRLYHAVKGWRALCGKVPGKTSDWSAYPGKTVTCPRCLRALGMMTCSECGQPGKDVKPAHEYPELAELLAAWGAANTKANLCPVCARAVAGDLRGETLIIIPLKN